MTGLEAAAWVAAGYLAGSVPVGYLWARVFRGIDIRQHGSGNIGATNVARVLESRAAGACVLVLDALKGFLPVAAAGLWGPRLDAAWREAPILATGLACVAGHCWPVTLGFAGGKGVATTLGVLVALWPLSAMLAALVWLATAALTRYVSAASVAAAASLPVWVFLDLTGSVLPFLFACALALAVAIRHRSNLERIRKGTEPKIGRKEGAGA